MNRQRQMNLAAGIAALAFLAGCATPPETTIRQPLTATPPLTVAVGVNNGSIFQGGGYMRPIASLYEDRRARYVGDTLTVNLVENTTAKRKSEVTDERKSNASVDISQPTVLGHTSPRIGQTSVNASASNKQEFKDNATNSSNFSGAVTVTVTEVMPNGNLRVAGEKQVSINADTDYIRLAGIVNPAQISASNAINSTQLADVQLESKNSQGLDKSQLTSMLARFFLTIMPF